MAKKKKQEIIFPRNVYKQGGNLVWSNKVKYSTELVANETEYNAALKAGFVDDFSEAIFGKTEVEEEIEAEYEVKEPIKKEVKKEVIDDDF